jgi:hypothetical protein
MEQCGISGQQPRDFQPILNFKLDVMDNLSYNGVIVKDKINAVLITAELKNDNEK